MTESDLMRIIGDYAAACVLANPNAERETAAKLRAAIRAYGNERAERALEMSYWPADPQVYR